MNSRVLCWLTIAASGASFILACQHPLPAASGEVSRETLIAAAGEIMREVRYCVLVTLDDSGRPRVRTMDPFPPDEKLIVWLATNRNTRKVEEIKNDPRVSLFYSAGEDGYVTIQGTASLIDDTAEKAGHWKEGWEEFYPEREQTYLLIQVIPESLEVVSYRRNLVGDPKDWKPPSVRFPVP